MNFGKISWRFYIFILMLVLYNSVRSLVRFLEERKKIVLGLIKFMLGFSWRGRFFMDMCVSFVFSVKIFFRILMFCKMNSFLGGWSFIFYVLFVYFFLGNMCIYLFFILLFTFIKK